MRAPEDGATELAADIAHRLFGVPAEEFRGIGDFAARVRQRLAVLDGDQLRQPLGVAHDQFVGLAQDLAALARLFRRPAGERGLRRVERGLGVLDRGARDRGDLVLGRRIDHVEAAAVGGFPPLAADPQIGRHVGEEIVVHSHGIILPTYRCFTAHSRASGIQHRVPGPRFRDDERINQLSIDRLHPLDDAVDASAARGLPECRRPAAECAAW